MDTIDSVGSACTGMCHRCCEIQECSLVLLDGSIATFWCAKCLAKERVTCQSCPPHGPSEPRADGES